MVLHLLILFKYYNLIKIFILIAEVTLLIFKMVMNLLNFFLIIIQSMVKVKKLLQLNDSYSFKVEAIVIDFIMINFKIKCYLILQKYSQIIQLISFFLHIINFQDLIYLLYYILFGYIFISYLSSFLFLYNIINYLWIL